MRLPKVTILSAYTSICLLSSGTLAWAESGPPESVEIVISANSADLQKPDRPLSTLSSQEVRSSQALNVSDLLNQSAPVYVDQSAAGSFVYLRGAESNYSGILLNGSALNDPGDSRGGAADLGRVGIGQIAKVEVLSAADAAILGPGFLAGAVNLIPQTLAEESSSIALGAGRMDLAQGRMRWLQRDTNQALGVFVDAAEHESIIPGFSRDHFNAGIEFEREISKELNARFSFNASGQNQKGYPDDSGGVGYAEQNSLERRNSDEGLGTIELEGNTVDKLHYLARYSHLLLDNDDSSPGVQPGLRDPFGIPPSESDSRLNRDALHLQAEQSLGDTSLLRASLDVSHEHSRSDAEIDFGGTFVPVDFERSRRAIGGLLEARQKLGRDWLLKLGSRMDQYQGFNAEFEPVAGLSYQIPNGPEIWSGYSEASKAPSIYALSHPLIGNPDLKLERGRTIEGGVRQKFSATEVALNLFKADYFDAVDFDEGPPPLLVNRDRIKTWGSEFLLKTAIAELVTCHSFMSFNEGDIVGVSQPLRSRPRWRAGAGCQYFSPGAWESSLNVRYVGSLEDSSIPTGDRSLDAYYQTDFQISRQLSSKLTLRLAVDNLFNDRHELQIGNRAVGIFPRASLEARF